MVKKPRKQKTTKHTVAATRVRNSHLVLPGHTNTHGSLFGGKLMEWIDATAAMSAMRHCRKPVVTASVDDLHFLTPVGLGSMVHVICEVIGTGRTSMEVEVNVIAEDPRSGKRAYTCVAYLTFVAIGNRGKPIKVPSISAESDDERKRHQLAKQRKQRRLERRRDLPVKCRLDILP